MNEKSLLKKIKSIKGIGYIAIGLVAALILLLIPTADGGEKADISDADDYRRQLEQSTENLLAEIKGVSSCTVVITLAYGFEYVYASDQTVEEHFSSTGGKESGETTKKYCFDGNGNGLLLREKMPVVTGVAVVCPGAPSEAQYRIISLLAALFDIGSNRICVQT